MKKKLLGSILAITMAVSMVACGNAQNKDNAQNRDNGKNIENEQVTDNTQIVQFVDSDNTVGKEQSAEPDRKLFTILADWSFQYSSGVGNWETNLYIDETGHFEGEYFDINYGEIGEGYDGTMYDCIFSGDLSNAVKIDDYIYEVQVTNLQYEREPDTEEIIDGIRYVYTESYGFRPDARLRVYLPGLPTEELPEKYLWNVDWRFNLYLFGNYVQNLPEWMTFCGLYDPDNECGFYSFYMRESNSLFLGNREKFPGLESQKAELREDGTYTYVDRDIYGMIEVSNLCFPTPAGMDMYQDTEAYVNACIDYLMQGQEVNGMYYFDWQGDDVEWIPQLLYIDNYNNIYANWESGGNEDIRFYSARILQVEGYSYLYAISYSDYDEFMRGEAEAFYLSSLSFSGAPDELSSASKDAVRCKIYAVVKPDPDHERGIMADEVRWVAWDDAEILTEYGLTYDDLTNDYAIVDQEENFIPYKISADCPCYVQYPENVMKPFISLEELWNYIDWEYGRLMILYLDENDQVTFLMEPYTP